MSPCALAAAIAAPFIGSFLAVIALRLPQGRSPLGGRSHCDGCGRALRAHELVPLLSFAGLGGRCSSCGSRIDPLHPALEAGALGIALWAAAVTPGWIVLASCGLGWSLLTLAAIDWRHGYLPDVITLPLAGAGLCVAWAIDPASALDHLIGAAAGLCAFALIAEIYRALRKRDGLGFGDAKLLAASGAWLSWQALPTVILFTALFGLGLVLAQRSAGRPAAASDAIPLGPALAAATWLIWLYGPLIPG